VAVVVGMTSAEATSAGGLFVTGGCPSRRDYGRGTAQGAARATIRYYIRKDPLIHVQGHLRLLRSVVADVHSYAAAYAQSLTAPEQIVAAFAAPPIGRG